jgi:hypothetical protein
MASGALAQATSPTDTDQNHSAHHPTAGEAPAATSKSSGTPSTNAQSGAGGMMSQGGMGPGGMMGQGGMMGPGGMMGGDMTQMMSMMRNMMNMMSAQSGMMTPNVEGRIASLKTELKITDAQTANWNRFAEAMRATAGSMNSMYEQMMQSGPATTLPARLERRETMLSAHLSRVKALKEALDPLYSSFTDEQKKIASGIMIGPMGMM